MAISSQVRERLQSGSHGHRHKGGPYRDPCSS